MIRIMTRTLAGISTEEHHSEYAHLSLGEMGPHGDTLAYLDGEQVNVFGGIPGEKVVGRIFRYKPRRKRNRRLSAIVTEVLEGSPYRIQPPCPYFGPCSGCQWQHIEYSHQLILKRDAVQRQLGRFKELSDVQVLSTIPCKTEYGYRNHARFTVRQKGFLGFVNRITRRFVQVDSCLLMSPWINDTLNRLQGRCQETSQLSVRYGINTGDWLVQPTLQGSDIQLDTGQTHYREMLLGKSFRVASPSFFQVNTSQAECLALLVRERLQLTGVETLIDAYAGVGIFAVLMSSLARQVLAIEESGAALKDASVNTLGIENLEFRHGKVEQVLRSLEKRPDAVILDPPRAGCAREVLEAVIKWAPHRVVYVSCDPETLARDLAVMAEGGLRIDMVEPIDMFPQTHHVECVATLST